MSAFISDLMPHEIRYPERPEPINFAFRRQADWHELSFCRSREEREQLYARMKRHAAHALAEHIAAHCKWMDRTAPHDKDLVLQIELTIQDRGAYENYIPKARQEGRSEGWSAALKAATQSLPYGLADAASDFYE